MDPSGPADDTLVSADAVPVAGHDGESVPTAIGRHLVERIIGAGGMGVVYMARDPTLDRLLAVKRMRGCEELADAERIQQEARLAAAVVHPNVVTIYDVGTDGGRVFVAMEYVDGQPLSRWLRKPRPWRDVLAVLVQAGRALAAAHAAGIVHRDFKPDNVLVARGLANDVHDAVVKVVDFGLAAAIAEVGPIDPGTGPQSSVVDATTRWIGTPAYMAAERHEGGRGDAKSDQFAFGVVAFEALFRARPFAGVSVAEIAASICDGRLERPPSSPVSRAVQRVIVRALARDPARRFPSMEALVDALVAAGRTRTRLVVAAATVIATLGLGAVALPGASEAACDGGEALVREAWKDGTRDRLLTRWGVDARAGAPGAVSGIDAWMGTWQDAHAQTCEDGRRSVEAAMLDARMGCLQRRFASARAMIEVLSEHSITSASAEPIVRGLPDPATCLADDAEPADTELDAARAALAADLGRAETLWYLGLYADAEPIADGLLERSDAIGDTADWVSAAILRANLWLAVNRLDEASTLLTLAYQRAIASGDDPRALKAVLAQATIAQMRGDHRALLHWARLAEVQTTRLHRADPKGRAMLALMLAIAHRLAGDLVTSLAYHHEALRLLDEHDLSGYIGVIVHMGAAETTLGAARLRDAEFHLDRAVAMAAVLQVNTSDPLALEQTRGTLYIAQRRPDLGLTSLLRTRARLAEIDQLDTDVALKATCTIADALEELGQTKAAMAEAEACFAGSERLGSDDPHHARALVRWGRISIAAGELDEGIARVERGLATLEHVHGAEHPEVAMAIVARAEGARRQGETARADVDEQRALRIHRDTARLGHIFQLVRLGRAAIDRGDLELARTRLQLAHELATASEGASGADALLAEALLLWLRAKTEQPDDAMQERARGLRTAIGELTGVDARAAMTALDEVLAHSR